MGETFEEKLRRVSLLDIYDDIAALEISSEQLIQSCLEIPCSVNLKTGNIVYSVEQKYKEKLTKYDSTKRLKWLNLNLKAIVPNPEAKLKKWQARHNENKKYQWVQRKMHVLDHFVKESLIIQSEDPCPSQSLRLAAQRRFSERSRVSSCRDTSCSTVGNTSTESVQTVIHSQQKNSVEEDFDESLPLFDFRNVSRSTLSSSSGELPSLVVEGPVVSEEVEVHTEPQTIPPPSSHNEKEHRPVRRAHLLPESEGPLSEEAYATFYQDMQVTSTQEFG